jgi:hypothetical protein
MALDSSLDIGAAVALFGATIGAWGLAAPLSLRARVHLRFAAVLFAALAVSVPLGMADVTALLLLPLASCALMISALARFAKPLAALPASVALVVGLGCGLGALIAGTDMPALATVTVAGLAVIAAAINGVAIMPVLAGAGLIAAGLAFTQEGSRGGPLLFCAAALIGLARPSWGQIEPLRRRDFVA